MTNVQSRELEAAGEAAEARRGRGGACEGSAEMSSGHWPSVRGNPDTGHGRAAQFDTSIEPSVPGIINYHRLFINILYPHRAAIGRARPLPRLRQSRAAAGARCFVLW